MSLADAIALAASELPDPGKPATITLIGGFGAFVGWIVGRVMRRPMERTQHMAFEGGFVGFAIGLALWLLRLAIDRL